MSNKYQLTNSEQKLIAIMEKYGNVIMDTGFDYMLTMRCSIHGGNGSWNYVGYGCEYEVLNGPDATSPVGETYGALEQVMWNAVENITSVK